MPELPEVETIRCGIAPHVVGKEITRVIVREARLRWPVPPELTLQLAGSRIHTVERRAKYLLLRNAQGCLLMHLGMSGSLRILPATFPAGRHDHVDIVFEDGLCLRLRDPRRFGALLWTGSDPLQHPLLSSLGPEPLEDHLNGDYLYERARGRSLAVKHFIMDSHIVAGVGNIYANEALFLAGIHPARRAGRIGRARYQVLACSIKQVLSAALAEGGTTLRNFHASDGKPGYFRAQLRVYGRAQYPCAACGRPVQVLRQGQRASYYCASCQR